MKLPNTPNVNAQSFSVRSHDRTQRLASNRRADLVRFRIHGPAGRGGGVMTHLRDALTGISAALLMLAVWGFYDLIGVV